MNRSRSLKNILTVRVSGQDPERFFNLCSFHGILLEDLRPDREGFLFSMEAPGFFKVRRLARKAGVKLSILEKRGIFFFLRRNRARLAFFAGIVSCTGFLYYSSLFIWDIHMEGNLKYTDSALLSFLEDLGYVHGMKKSGIVCEDLEKEIRAAYGDITWVSAEISGNRLIVRVKENQVIGTEEEEAESALSGDLTAAKAGTIVSIITRAGTPKVHAGDVVEAGQVLISGTLEITDEGGNLLKTEEVRADGDVTARLLYHYEDSFPLATPVRHYSGEETSRHYLWFLGKRLYLPGGKNRYEASDRIDRYTKLHLWGDFYLPIGWGTVTAREYEEAFRVYSEEEAKEQARLRFETWCENLSASGTVLEDTQLTVTVEDGICRSTGLVQATESIAVRGEP